MTINGTGASLPLQLPAHIARAYGVKGVGAVRATTPVAPVEPVRRQDDQGGKLSEAGRRLVAAVVPGKVDFSGPQGVPGTGLSIYKHPAEKNVAATGVWVGRGLDVRG
jgi:hypothetical protein